VNPRWAIQRINGLRIQHKVWVALLLLCVPLAAGIAVHLYFVQQLLVLQQQRHELMLAEEMVQMLGRLAIDIEDGFRGYVLTQQSAFLAPLADAEAKLDRILPDVETSLEKVSDLPVRYDRINHQVKSLLRSKHELIADIQNGPADKALAYVRSGEGLRLSDVLRGDLRTIETLLEQKRNALHKQADALSERTFVGLWVTLAGVVALGWLVSRILARALTDPITRLQSATARIGGHVNVAEITELLSTGRGSKDELGQLAEAYLAMALRIEANINELEALDTIGQEINAIGFDDLEIVLRRIADKGVELVKTDICLVLLREERLSYWSLEAASGEWNKRLKKSVMAWEELPVGVQAFETRTAAVGEQFHSDESNPIRGSMLASPLLAEGRPLGVLLFVSERPRMDSEWNQRLAEGLALDAAQAIVNARLHEAAQQRQRELVARLRQLEHLAETLAHDLKGPGARMGELARLLIQQDTVQFDTKTKRWLSLIEENGRDLVQRVEGLLTVASVSADSGTLTAVDPTAAIGEVLKARAEEIAQREAVVHVEPGLPLVACHGTNLRQIFDNLISNGLKFARDGGLPVVKVSAQLHGTMVMFAVEDNGIGVPSSQRTRVFQPFVRLLTSDAPGSGIGLTITQRIVELYGGSVWIDSAEVPGCTVRFTIPRFQPRGALEAERHTSSVLDAIDGIQPESR